MGLVYNLFNYLHNFLNTSAIMNKSTFIFGALLTSVTWFSWLFVQDIELNLMKQFPDEVWGKIVPAYWRKKDEWFSWNSVWSVHHNINNFKALRLTCKTLNNLLTFKRIGNICTNNDQKRKNETFDYWIYHLPCQKYSFNKYLSILTLFCADVDDKNKGGVFLLKYAVQRNKKQLVEILFQNEVSPNIRNKQQVPLLMFAETVEMVELFLKYGANVHAIDHVLNCNVLSVTLYPKYPFKLMEFYLKNGVDAELLNKDTDSCLLHQLVDQCVRNINWYSHWKNDCNDDHDMIDSGDGWSRYYAALRQEMDYKINNFLQKGALLLEAMSQKTINKLNKNGETAIDSAQRHLEQIMKQRLSIDKLWGEWKLITCDWWEEPYNTDSNNYFLGLRKKYLKDRDAKSFLQAIKLYFQNNQEVRQKYSYHTLDWIEREAGEYEKIDALGQLIALYRAYGCLTTKELEQKKFANIMFFLVNGIKIVSMVTLAACLLLSLSFT